MLARLHLPLLARQPRFQSYFDTPWLPVILCSFTSLLRD